jgi:hypothetical protein
MRVARSEDGSGVCMLRGLCRYNGDIVVVVVVCRHLVVA